eukprot:Skav214434  [mRNA]  locus=scaffold586:431837:434234:- [translate_table: standard]
MAASRPRCAEQHWRGEVLSPETSASSPLPAASHAASWPRIGGLAARYRCCYAAHPPLSPGAAALTVDALHFPAAPSGARPSPAVRSPGRVGVFPLSSFLIPPG